MSSLLPSNASEFEKNLSVSTDVLTKLGLIADAVARFKSLPDDPLLPFLEQFRNEIALRTRSGRREACS